MKGIGILGTDGHIPHVAFMDTAEAMRRVGNNTGNLLFQYAVYNLIDEPKYLIGQDIPWDMAQIREKCRVIVIPAANFIRENFDLTAMVEFLEKIDLPLLFFGLGAQARDYEQTEFDFHPSIDKLIALIRERSKLVSVRGEFTARMLDRMGVSQALVTGCPSNHINPSTELPQMIAKKLAKPMRSFITHGDEPWPKDRAKQAVERKLVAWTREGASMMSQQSVPVFMEYLRNNNPAATTEIPEKREGSLHAALMPGTTMDEFLDFIAAKLRVYFSVHQWMEDSSKYDFSVGLRLHGNMVAWQAGTPALWVYHDSRTQELAETMALPRMPFQTFIDECETVQDAWKRVEFDPVAYGERRALLKSRIVKVMETEGIKVRGYQPA
ncbi:MAG: hypothetical protein CML50_03115 [Rhodobacteraceae bacterium]|nr:hypothetical protein [Paracoccaceae bacterium]